MKTKRRKHQTKRNLSLKSEDGKRKSASARVNLKRYTKSLYASSETVSKSFKQPGRERQRR